MGMPLKQLQAAIIDNYILMKQGKTLLALVNQFTELHIKQHAMYIHVNASMRHAVAVPNELT